ncbi:MAG: 4Fe-4S dicluster domain-containing protein [Acidobacteriota bacterium]
MRDENVVTSAPERPSRRGVVGLLAAGAASVAGWVFGGTVGRRAVTGRGATAQAPLPVAPGNRLVKMQAELHEALARPLAKRKWVMVVDTRACIGCQACVINCRAENVTGPAGSYRRVPEAPAGRYPNLTNVFMPTNCVQCDDPPCQRAVPAGMITKRADGIVEFDYSQLKGQYAQAAARACPYRAVHVDDGKFFTDGTPAVQAYERRRFVEYHREIQRTSGGLAVGAARKCHFCLHRIEAGILPACVTACIGGAMFFGDLNDPASTVSELLRTQRSIRIHEEAGIEPRVYYVEDGLQGVPGYACATCH